MNADCIESSSSTAQSGNLGRLLLRAARDFSELAGEKLKARGHRALRLGHADLIANLDLQGTRITTLAERAGMTKQAMGPLVKELTEAGYLERSVDETDRRAVLVKLTPAGEQLVRDVQAVVTELEAHYAVVIGSEQLEALRTSLSLLIHFSHNTEGRV